MPEFKFKVSVPDEFLRDHPLEATINSKSPNHSGTLSWEGGLDLELLELLQLRVADFAPFVVNTNIGGEIFQQGQKIDPWFFKLALDKFQSKGYLSYEMVENKDLLELVPLSSNLTLDENY